LKIDRPFVQQITADSEDSLIVSAIINMGKSLTSWSPKGSKRKNKGHIFRVSILRKDKATSSAGPYPQFARLLQMSTTETVLH
jgi:hypothetical protein